MLLPQWDSPGAYLQADATVNPDTATPEDYIYINNIPGFQIPKGKMLRMLKALYGFIESGKFWSIKVNDALITNGFIRSTHDPCVYVLAYSQPQQVKPFVVWLHGDDMRTFSDKLNEHEWFMQAINEHISTAPVVPDHLLGCKISINADYSTEMYMTSYFDKVISRFGTSQMHGVKIPIVPHY